MRAAARYIHSTLKNTSMGMTNQIGPVEKMALAIIQLKAYTLRWSVHLRYLYKLIILVRMHAYSRPKQILNVQTWITDAWFNLIYWQSLSVTIISYMEKLRVSVVAEDGFIDSQKLKSCVEHAFEVMLNAKVETKFLNSH